MTSHFVVVSDARFIPELNKLVDEPFVDLTERVITMPETVCLLVNGSLREPRLPVVMAQEADVIIRDMVLQRGHRNVALVIPQITAQTFDRIMRTKYVGRLVLNYSNVLFISDDFARLVKYHPSPELNFQLLLETLEQHTTAFDFTDSMLTRREREAAKRSYLRGEQTPTQDSVE